MWQEVEWDKWLIQAEAFERWRTQSVRAMAERVENRYASFGLMEHYLRFWDIRTCFALSARIMGIVQRTFWLENMEKEDDSSGLARKVGWLLPAQQEDGCHFGFELIGGKGKEVWAAYGSASDLTVTKEVVAEWFNRLNVPSSTPPALPRMRGAWARIRTVAQLRELWHTQGITVRSGSWREERARVGWQILAHWQEMPFLVNIVASPVKGKGEDWRLKGVSVVGILGRLWWTAYPCALVEEMPIEKGE